MKTRGLAAGLLALVSWFGGGCGCDAETTVYPEACAGSIAGPSALNLDKGLPSTCRTRPGGCEVSPICLDYPDACTDTCFGLDANGLVLRFDVNPSGAPSFKLPDARVGMEASLGGAPLTVTDGSLSVRIGPGHFEGHFSLTMATSAGEQIRVADGSYAVSKGTQTYCEGN